MEHAIIRDFKITRDFRSIAWGATLGHNLLRAFCAGIVWAIIFAILTANGPSNRGVDPEATMMYLAPVILPLAYLFVYMPIGMVCAFVGQFIPFVGLVTLLIALIIVVGDPLVWVLSLFAPRVVPMEKPGFLMFSLIIWLLKSETAVDFTISDQRQGGLPPPLPPISKISPRGINKL